MEFVLFFIFLACDLLVVLVCRFSFGDQTEYREGMLMGVHIPEECVHDPEAEELCKKNKRAWTLFQRVNLAVSLLLCFLCFWNMIVFMILWTIWLLEYVAGIYYLILIPHRRMYRLKLRRGWICGKGRHQVCIDTAVSAASQRLSVNWKWHLPVLLVTAASLFLVSGIRQRYQVDAPEQLMIWILYGTGVGLCLMFLVLHLGIERQANRVYSENSQVNLAVNRAVKRAWTEGLVLASWTNGAAWLFWAAVYYVTGPNMPLWIYIVYTILLTLAAVVLAVPVVRLKGKKKQILEADTEPYFTDDDEYWKNGWYNNPADRHILVQDRFNSMNYTFNFGRPGVKKVVAVLYLLTILSVPACILWAVSLMNSFNRAEVKVTEEDGQYTIEAAGYEYQFRNTQIGSVELTETLPDDDYIRTNGGSTDQVDIGHFRGKDTGKCMMFLYRDYTPVLEIRLKDGMTVFANSRDPEDTEVWYQMLEGAVQ